MTRLLHPLRARAVRPSLVRPGLVDLLRSAELLLAQTGSAVALRPVHGEPVTGAPGLGTGAAASPVMAAAPVDTRAS